VVRGVAVKILFGHFLLQFPEKLTKCFFVVCMIVEENGLNPAFFSAAKMKSYDFSVFSENGKHFKCFDCNFAKILSPI